MKFIHTADWHLGKLFYGTYLTEEQAFLLREEFLPLLDREKPDAVILAGDVYDRSVPPAEAVELFDEMVSEIAGRRKIPFLVISGNHDSAERLSFGSRLFADRGLHIFGDLVRTVHPVLLPDAWGDVAFVPLPYIETAEVRHFLKEEGMDEEEAERIRTHEDAERALSEHLLAEIPAGTRTVAIAHDFIAGGAASDSERPLSIGGSEVISADIFAPYDYTALGHLHGPQKAGGSEVIRYSGSLLKYSFGEAKQKKGCLVCEIDGEGHVTSRFEALKPRHDVRIITGTFEELMAREDEAPEDFLMAELTDDGPIFDAMARLRGKYPNMMTLRLKSEIGADSGERLSLHEKVGMMDMLQAFSETYRDGRRLSEEEAEFMRGLMKGLEDEA